MPQPTAYARQYSFQAYQVANPEDPLPGQKVDIELNAVKTTLDEILTNLALIQRDDGEIANNSIGTSQLDGSLISLGFERPSAWVTATAYAVDDAVFQSNKLYLCLTAHTSGTFSTDLAAVKWEEVIDFTTLVTDAEAARDDAQGYAADALASKNSALDYASDIFAGGSSWYGATTGTNAYTLATNDYQPGVRPDGFEASFLVVIANTGAVDVTIGGYTIDDVKHITGAEISSGEWPANSVQTVKWSTTLGYYVWSGANPAAYARLSAANTFAAAILFSSTTEFDGAANFDSTVDFDGAANFDAAAEFNSDMMVDGDMYVTGGAGGMPGGRLTLTTAVPVLTSDVTAATTVYYAPYLHNAIWLYDGTRWRRHFFSEMSQTLADNIKSPAAAAVSSNYDMFVWNDAGTLRCTRGPAWTSGTARGTGAATTELERVNGVWVNKIAITNGPAAQRGVYVGTISTSATGANGQLNMMFSPAAAAGGSANRLDVWNMYNRVEISSLCRDNTDTWAYTTATWRSANASDSNRITVICGLNENAARVTNSVLASNSGTNAARNGIGLDSTSAFSGLPGGGRAETSTATQIVAFYSGLVGLGSHFVQALEYSQAAGTTTWWGDNAEPLNVQSGMLLTWQM